MTTFTYSKLLKKIPVVDLVTLACLYLLRIIGGASITSLEISNWLITFSVFFFLFLAGIKRWIEIERSSGALLSSRGYVKEDINFMTHLSYFCGLISVLIICLYIDSQQASMLYSNSRILWFIPMILLFWIIETLFLVTRKKVDDDPVLYALKSKTSYVCCIFLIIIFYFAI
jgi:4-hydroxybenzoate polyprenyltransferase